MHNHGKVNSTTKSGFDTTFDVGKGENVNKTLPKNCSSVLMLVSLEVVNLEASVYCSKVKYIFRSEHVPVAVAARDLSRAQKFADLHEIAKAYGNYEDLAKDPNVEVAYIGVTAPHHFQGEFFKKSTISKIVFKTF